MRPTVLLFDVDGTLITTAGAGRRAIERAFAVHYKRSDTFRDINFGGMTDRAIVRAGLGVVGESTSGPGVEATIDTILATYLPILAEEVGRATTIRLHAGIGAALDAAAARSDVALGLGTGNVREGARVKLEHVGVFERFAFGGFGSDHEDRAELIRIGAARGAAALGVAATACRVVVVGDTPKDVAAARAIGAESLGVGTSNWTAAALQDAGATWAFADLAAPGAVHALLNGQGVA